MSCLVVVKVDPGITFLFFLFFFFFSCLSQVTSGPTDTFAVASQIATSVATGMFSSLTNKSDNGIRIYKSTTLHDDVDETDFVRRKMHVLQAERDHKAVLEAIASKLRIRNGTFLDPSPSLFLSRF